MKDFKTFIENLSLNENLLVPRNIKERRVKRKQMNIRLLSQEVIDGDLDLDESFMDIDAKFVKLKKVNGFVLLNGEKWKEIPVWLKDVEITGGFNCLDNKLKTLKNCPRNIGGLINFSFNKLISLDGCPEIIKGHFDCLSNKLVSLSGGPKIVNGNFNCAINNLTTLEGCPEIIEGYFVCSSNEIKLELPDYVKLKGKFRN